jgi:hypothetical protein
VGDAGGWYPLGIVGGAYCGWPVGGVPGGGGGMSAMAGMVMVRFAT